MARKVLIQIRRGLEANIGTLSDGELGYCTDTKKLFVGTAASGNVLLASGLASGDMLKSIYDTNGNGKVDSAEVADSVAWAGVTGRPTTLSGYGISDGATKLEVSAKLSPGVTWNQLKGV
jgi:hypothetical protein